jgi:cyclohexanone monooxygenase
VTVRELDVVVVGAGFGGMYAVHRLRELGFDVHAFEAGSDVGGVWYWNRYPGARCDIESVEYSYSFSEELQQEWEWSQRYPTQPEMLAYADHVAGRFDLRRHITFDTRIVSAHFDETSERWRLTTDTGDTISAWMCVMATGVLSAPRLPDFPGLDRFTGDIHQTAQWPHEPVDFTGQRVGVIGTGSSGIQVIPHLAAQADQLYVFQRTANFSISGANEPLDAETVRRIKADYPALREHARRSFGGSTIPLNRVSALAASEEELVRTFEERWRLGGFAFLAAFDDITLDERANELAAEFVRDKIRTAVDDPQVADLLMPRDHPIGSKRICVDTGYYETYNRPNVHLVDLRATPIETFTETGLRVGATDYELDSVVLATGFDALTGALSRIDIRGRGGRTLRDEWADGACTYLGLMVSGFPNLFTMTGPGSPSVLSNMILAIEHHVDWIGACLTHLRDNGLTVIEATQTAQDEWVQHVRKVAEGTLYPRAESWYLGSNIPGKARMFLPYVGGVGRYRKKCDEIAQRGYAGFELTGSATTAPDAMSVAASSVE